MNTQTQTSPQTLAQAILAASDVTIMYGGPQSGKSTALSGISAAAVESGLEVVVLDPLAPDATEFLEALTADLQNDRKNTGVYPLVIVEDLDVIAKENPELVQLVKDVSVTPRNGFSMIVTMQTPDAAIIPNYRNSVTLAAIGQGISERDARCAFPNGYGQAAYEAHKDLARNHIAGVGLVQTHLMQRPALVTF